MQREHSSGKQYLKLEYCGHCKCCAKFDHKDTATNYWQLLEELKRMQEEGAQGIEESLALHPPGGLIVYCLMFIVSMHIYTRGC